MFYANRIIKELEKKLQIKNLAYNNLMDLCMKLNGTVLELSKENEALKKEIEMSKKNIEITLMFDKKELAKHVLHDDKTV